jgi:hypothetical protein
MAWHVALFLLKEMQASMQLSRVYCVEVPCSKSTTVPAPSAAGKLSPPGQSTAQKSTNKAPLEEL